MERRRALAPGGAAARARLLGRLDRGFRTGATAAALGFVGLAIALVVALLEGAGPAIGRFGPSFLGSSASNGVHNLYGATPAIAGTLLTAGLALALAVPLGLGVAIFLSELGPRKLRKALTYAVDLSAAVPSVVWGFWAFLVLVPVMRSSIEPGAAVLYAPLGAAIRWPILGGTPLGLDVSTASIVLAIMIVPTIAAVSREALSAVPALQREAALALGATRWEATRLAVLRPARSGIFGGIVLSLGRAVGETIAVTMVIGNFYALPTSLLSPGQTLARQIATNFGEVGQGLEQDALIELGRVLFAITVGVNVVARLMLRRLVGGRRRARPRPSRVHRRHLPALGAPGSDGSGSAQTAGRPTIHGWRTRPGVAGRLVRRRWTHRIALMLALACVLTALAPLASVVATDAVRGVLAVVQPSFYVSPPPLGCNPGPGRSCALGGIGPALEGSLIVLGIAALVALPAGLVAGIYLSEYGRSSRHALGRGASFLTDVMTGVHTIPVGIFVFMLFLRFDHDAALSALSGGVALGVVMVPIVIRATEEALKSVPDGLREAALALGFPRQRTSLRVVLGTARTAVVTGALLALSRAAGDTAAVLLTAGGSNVFLSSLNQPTAAITLFIFVNFGSEYTNLQEDAWGAALVLLAIMLAIALGGRLLIRRPGVAPGAV